MRTYIQNYGGCMILLVQDYNQSKKCFYFNGFGTTNSHVCVSNREYTQVDMHSDMDSDLLATSNYI